MRPFSALDPLADSEGLVLEKLSGRKRARSGKDF